MELITYQKRNGETIERKRATGIRYKVGEYTSMGWKVLDIKYGLNGKYYPLEIYNDLVERNWIRSKKRVQFKRNIVLIYNNINHILLFIILAKLLEKIIVSMR